ncbi:MULTISPECIES: hypothetical protein [unclassified Pseudomonas]|uniref:hypothetical protein n=1 Tax=unclassified Pseudomonas TaxID=196821 RepID=UPI001EDFE929|nr:MULTISPECIES: hypothetical protein [unclassified Pseudomonas]MCG4452832.1 hypothetical protein [Pseudomonas sp. MMS21 TM103]
MTHLTWTGLALVLLAVAGLAYWNWRSNRQLRQLDQRVRRQSELLEQIDSVLENPQLSEDEQRAQSEALLAKLRESSKP